MHPTDYARDRTVGSNASGNPLRRLVFGLLVALLLLALVVLIVRTLALGAGGTEKRHPALVARAGWIGTWSPPTREQAPGATEALTLGAGAHRPDGSSAAPVASQIVPLAVAMQDQQVLALVGLDPAAPSSTAERAEGAQALYWVAPTDQTWQALVVTMPSTPVASTSNCTGQLLPLPEQAFATSCTRDGPASIGLSLPSGVRAIGYLSIWVLAAPNATDARLVVAHVRSFGAPLGLDCPGTAELAAIEGTCAAGVNGTGTDADLRLVLVLGLHDTSRAQDFARIALGDADTLLAS